LKGIIHSNELKLSTVKKFGTLLAINVFMSFLLSLTAQIPNGGFEDWVVDGNDNNPVDWRTSNSDPILSVTPYAPAYAGNFSMKVSTYDAGVLIVPGVATAEFPYAQRPSEINACIKTTVMPGDKVLLIISMYHEDSIVALPTDCSFSIDSTISDFTCLSFPITYQSELIPDSAIIIVMAGSAAPQVGTEIIVDELSFTTVNTSVDQMFATTIYDEANYPNPAGDFTFIPVNLAFESDVEILVWDMNGKIVQSLPFRLLPAGKHDLLVNTDELTNGIYLYSVRGKDYTFNGKIVVDK
jgi:hypothetical protein